MQQVRGEEHIGTGEEADGGAEKGTVPEVGLGEGSDNTAGAVGRFFVYCFECWHWAWSWESPDVERLRCSKCGSKDVGSQAIDEAWGKDWHSDWVASYLTPDLESAEDGGAAR